jgi:hypothetical protein
MNVAVQRAERAPYFDGAEERETARRRRERLLDNAYGAMMTLLGVAAVVALRIALLF